MPRQSKPKDGSRTAPGKHDFASGIASVSRETRRLLVEAGRASRVSRRLLGDPALVGFLLPTLVHRMPFVSVSSPEWMAIRLDPWRSPMSRSGEELSPDQNTSIALRLLDGRRGRLVRTIRRDPSGRIRHEVFFEDETGIRHYDLSSLLLPLCGYEDLSRQGGPVVITEGVRAADALRAQGLQAVGTLCGPFLLPPRTALEPVLDSTSIVLWPLPDANGWAHMQQLAAQLARMGATSTRIVGRSPMPMATIMSPSNAKGMLSQAAEWRPSYATPFPRLRLPRTAVRLAHLRTPVERSHGGRLARPATAIRLAGVRRLAERLKPHLLRALRDEPLSLEQRRRLMDVAGRLYESIGDPLMP